MAYLNREIKYRPKNSQFTTKKTKIESSSAWLSLKNEVQNSRSKLRSQEWDECYRRIGHFVVYGNALIIAEALSCEVNAVEDLGQVEPVKNIRLPFYFCSFRVGRVHHHWEAVLTFQFLLLI